MLHILIEHANDINKLTARWIYVIKQLPVVMRGGSQNLVIKSVWRHFIKLIWNSFQNDEEWCLFYCGNTLCCQVIQDNDLCKLDDFWCNINVHSKWRKITKNGISQQSFETLYSCYTHRKVPQYVQCDISMAKQWVSGPLLSKGKTRVFLLQEVLVALDVHPVGVS